MSKFTPINTAAELDFNDYEFSDADEGTKTGADQGSDYIDNPSEGDLDAVDEDSDDEGDNEGEEVSARDSKSGSATPDENIHQNLVPSVSGDLDECSKELNDKECYEYDRKKFGRYPQTKGNATANVSFDANGDLWYSRDQKSARERAVFHHWVRAKMIQEDSVKGTYIFSRNSGVGKSDKTSYCAFQHAWGNERPNYAAVMFEYQRRDRRDSAYPIGEMKYGQRLVVDYWLSPVRNFRELPRAISSEYEGAYMEPAHRYHSKIVHADLRARMPPFLEAKIKSTDQIRFHSLPLENTFSNRRRRFRERAGAISWKLRTGTKEIKAFMDELQPDAEAANSTKKYSDLTFEQLELLRTVNGGHHPERKRKDGSKEGHNKYLAHIQETREKAEDKGESSSADQPEHEEPAVDGGLRGDAGSHDDSYHVSSSGNLIPSKEDLSSTDADVNHVSPGAGMNQEEKGAEEKSSEIALSGGNVVNDREVEHTGAHNVDNQAAPREKCSVIRKYSARNGRHLTLSDDAAATNPDIDHSDCRNGIPKNQWEQISLMRSLEDTVQQFRGLTGEEPVMLDVDNYFSHWYNMQLQVDVFYRGGPESPRLTMRKKWTGGIELW